VARPAMGEPAVGGPQAGQPEQGPGKARPPSELQPAFNERVGQSRSSGPPDSRPFYRAPISSSQVQRIPTSTSSWPGTARVPSLAICFPTSTRKPAVAAHRPGGKGLRVAELAATWNHDHLLRRGRGGTPAGRDGAILPRRRDSHIPEDSGRCRGKYPCRADCVCHVILAWGPLAGK
jgi:hypothetical protein